MAADQPTGVPAPEGTASLRPAEDVPDAAAVATAIPALPAPPVPVIGVPDDPRTGEPKRPRTVALATGAGFVGVANIALALLTVYWDAVPKENFAHASWLMGQFVTEPGSLGRVLLAVAVTVIALVMAVPLAITAYYGWAGYRWARVSALIAAGLSFGALTLNVFAWSSILWAVVTAVLLWTPVAGRFFTAWSAKRHRPQAFAPPTVDVVYGPLPKYRHV